MSERRRGDACGVVHEQEAEIQTRNLVGQPEYSSNHCMKAKTISERNFLFFNRYDNTQTKKEAVCRDVAVVDSVSRLKRKKKLE